MTRIMKYQWSKNKDALRKYLANDAKIANYKYIDFVKIVFDKIYNAGLNGLPYADVNDITEIDNGDYQGTLLYLIPFKRYQPEPSEYLMTFVYYGSCGGCDTLLGISEEYISPEERLPAYMSLCKDIVANTIKPYNYGWRNSTDFEPAEEEG